MAAAFPPYPISAVAHRTRLTGRLANLIMDEKTPHIPVLLAEVLAAAKPRAGDVIVDATFGAGGYAQAFLEKGASVIAFDRDSHAKPAAETIAKKFPDQFQFINAPFGQMEKELQTRGISCVDAIIFDLGVSSMQIDEAARGFSFMRDGPLDMRMGDFGKTAAGLVSTLGEKELADILYRYGEEKRSRAIAKAIVQRREEQKFTRTKELGDLIEKTIGRDPRSKIHPATRSFQALRIAVNDELGELERALQAAQNLLKSGGRLAVVTFHSLEDRIVKQFLTPERIGSRHVPEKPLAPSLWKPQKLIAPGKGELSSNPRARSAKLRVAQKI